MNPVSQQKKPLKALLVAIQLPKIADSAINESLAELSRLVSTLGYEVMGQISQKRNSERGANVVGDGKLRELARWTGGTGIIAPMVIKKKHKAALKFNANPQEDELEGPEEFEDELDTQEDSPGGPVDSAEIIVFDCDLSPSQLRNLESATGVTVLDRTGVIIEIFSRHARTRAAKLQVEIARLTYVAPRLRETGGSEDQQGGGGKGAGETSLELDRRKIRDRIKELKESLNSIAREQDQRRARRDQENSIALVGYTNAGKSSLMRALTGSEVLVADQLFATLDTTVRLMYPETQPKILISDTVGFIKKLPHDLVASFKSTLDEALSASLLLYVVDSSDPSFRSQLAVTKTVLAEVGAGEIESILVLNKVDRLSQSERTNLEQEYPQAIFLSARNKDDVARLRLRLLGYFETDMVDQDLLIPYDVQGAIGEIRAKMRVLSESYQVDGVVFKVRSSPEQIQRLVAKYGVIAINA
jgi:GTP-binding protein HflX